jgi:hypothetical protein
MKNDLPSEWVGENQRGRGHTMRSRLPKQWQNSLLTTTAFRGDLFVYCVGRHLSNHSHEEFRCTIAEAPYPG